MNLRFKTISIIGFSLTSTLFLFQNCGPNKFQSVNTEAIDLSSTAQNSTNSLQSANDQGGPNNQIPAITNPSGGQSSAISSSGTSSAPTTSSSNSGSSVLINTGNAATASTTPAVTSSKAVNCSNLLAQLGWNSTSFVRVDFLPADNMTPSANVEFAYDRFKIGFFAKTNQASFLERFKMDESGFAIKLRNKSNGQSFQIPTSFFKAYSSGSDVGSHGTASVMKVGNENLARVYIDVSRTFYENYKSQLGAVEVELSCNGSAGPKATQDFRALSPSLDVLMRKMQYGYLPDSNGFANLTCVEEISSGGQIDCSIAGLYIDKIKWFYDDVEYPNFSNLAAVKFSSVTAGLHSVQAMITYKDGSSGATLMKFIRAK